jgi:hypothetical protein
MFNIKIIVPSYVKMQSLLNFINNQLRSKQRRPVVSTGWFNVDVPMMASVIGHTMNYLVQEQDVKEKLGRIREMINNFVDVLSNRNIAGNIRDIMYRLYGMQSPADDESFNSISWIHCKIILRI